MPLDHVSLPVPKDKFEDVISFLTNALQHMGFKEMFRPVPTVVGMGDTEAYFWLNAVDMKADKGVLSRQHIAITAKNAEQVRQFHAAALKAGATCNGPPGLRADYHPSYYAAFVIDPLIDLNLEVVCHAGEA